MAASEKQLIEDDRKMQAACTSILADGIDQRTYTQAYLDLQLAYKLAHDRDAYLRASDIHADVRKIKFMREFEVTKAYVDGQQQQRQLHAGDRR